MPAVIPEQNLAPEAVAPEAVAPSSMTPQSALATLDRVVNGRGDENDRKSVSDIVAKKNAADQEGHLNTHTQWGPLIGALLMRQYDKAINHFNGGETRFEEGRTADNQRVFKQYNQRGFTGVYANPDGTPVDPKIAKQLEDKGVITRSDEQALKTAAFENVKADAVARATGLRVPVVQAMDAAFKTSNIMSQTNNLLAERDRLSQSPALNIISKLSPDQRADLFGFKTGLKTENKGTTKGQTESKSGSFTGTETSNANANLDLTGGSKGGTGAGGAAVPPKVGGGVGIGGSTGATNQSTASGNLGAETTSTASAGQQQQEDIMSKIQRYTQNAIKTPEEFQAVQRWVQLTQKIHEIQSNIPPEMMAPGSRAIPPESLGLTSGKEATVNSLETQRNNALASAWSAFVAKKVRDNTFEGLEANREEFMKSNTYKGIDYKYDSVIGAVKNGKPHQPKAGDIDVGPNNRPRIFKDGQWEPLNER